MSRVANLPVNLPSGVEFKQEGSAITVKGDKGTLSHRLHPSVEIKVDGGEISFAPRKGHDNAVAFAGTSRAVISNMVTGVSQGFEKRLQLVGVGYRAQVQGKKVNLSLGFSHPVDYPVPEGISIEAPSQTELVIKGADKQQVGQVAAEIRAFRPPEPYKGKGVRYSDEHVVRKEAKKK